MKRRALRYYVWRHNEPGALVPARGEKAIEVRCTRGAKPYRRLSDHALGDCPAGATPPIYRSGRVVSAVPPLSAS